METNTIVTARQNKLLINKPKVPGKSGCILGNLKHTFVSASAKRIIANEKDALML